MSDYVCPQCGPDQDGPEVHQLVNHSLNTSRDYARELIRLQAENARLRAGVERMTAANIRLHEDAALLERAAHINATRTVAAEAALAAEIAENQTLCHYRTSAQRDRAALEQAREALKKIEAESSFDSSDLSASLDLIAEYARAALPAPAAQGKCACYDAPEHHDAPTDGLDPKGNCKKCGKPSAPAEKGEGK